MLVAGIAHWFLHWTGADNLSGPYYGEWSGFLSDLGEYVIAVTLITGAVGWFRKHNCHVHRCWRLSWHPHPIHGHPVCRKHHPHGEKPTHEALCAAAGVPSDPQH